MKRTPLNRVRKNKSKKQKLFEKAWKICSEYIRRRDKGKCFTCSTIKHWKGMEAGHFRHGKGSPIYFDERNIHAQCSRCNRLYSGQRDIYLRKIQKLYGIEVGDWLIKESYKTHYYTIKELEGVIKYYQEKIASL